jgi:hypothetical protein
MRTRDEHRAAILRGMQVMDVADVARCEVTKNPVGTDTWAAGHECKCASCQKLMEVLDRALRRSVNSIK